MTTHTATHTATDTGLPRSHPARIYVTEARHEFLKLIRIPIFAVSTIALPVMFYVLFGLAFGGGESRGVGATTYMMVTYGTFGVIGAALFGFGVSVAVERGQGWMRLKRVSPMPPQAYFVAKVVMATAVSALIIGILFLLGATLGGVRMPATQWIGLGLVLILGALPFSAMGLAFGYLVGPNSAPALLNVIYLPMAFASGLWIPIHQLPEFVQGIAPALPPYHFAQLALGTIGAAEGGSQALHVVVLLAFTALFLAVALWGYRRDEGRTYG
ncbi:ABC transporter permease [Tessaracoccus sp. MC1627]|uniref:ABC transporter permease n=1 Tax=Tessaracoccus sp. MC1627 TaxID=2760312 RepID=UPI0016012680|nr:ABC transporter permease [Tessaracoccus sp. MC1627]MBB1513295.1 ABC transporter permease [Tessaracoccus sp. MC1627]